MSMATYIGLNFTVKLNEYVTENEVEINYVFSEKENRDAVKKQHFTTPYIYEVFQKGKPIWQLNEYHKSSSPHNYEKSKKTLLYLCQLLKELIPQGDYCEIYISWLDEEEEERENDLEIDLNNLQIESIDIDEKCFIRIKN